MKKIISLLSVCFSLVSLSNFAQAELPPKVEGENFQRVEKSIDCQNFRIPEFKGAHPEINRTTCFYKIFIIESRSKQEGGNVTRENVPLIMYVETNNLTGEVSTGYLHSLN